MTVHTNPMINPTNTKMKANPIKLILLPKNTFMKEDIPVSSMVLAMVLATSLAREAISL